MFHLGLTRSTHVPYRNSKLTHLLENALGGDSNICVICTLSAEEANCAETLETLKFAGRCSQVETQAKKNVVSAEASSKRDAEGSFSPTTKLSFEPKISRSRTFVVASMACNTARPGAFRPKNPPSISPR
jgi:hypothetical protein